MRYLITNDAHELIKEVRCPEQFLSLQYNPATEKCWTIPENVIVPTEPDNGWFLVNATPHLEEKK